MNPRVTRKSCESLISQHFCVSSLVCTSVPISDFKIGKELNDISDGCGSKFQAVIVSEKFVGKSRIDRQRLVYTIIADEMKQIHAFSQRTLTPEEWEKEKK